jgi:hypothetical protein
VSKIIASVEISFFIGSEYQCNGYRLALAALYSHKPTMEASSNTLTQISVLPFYL